MGALMAGAKPVIRAVSPPVWFSHEHNKYGWSQFASKLHTSELKENEYVSKNLLY